LSTINFVWRPAAGAAAAGKIHWRNTRDQLQLVGPKSLGVALLTAGFVGMVFTIQVGEKGG
jgi:ABC-type transporter Mla maintaining outer membrane lipid asymmetry permease subunit MlaE